jgi:hypothetical protein
MSARVTLDSPLPSSPTIPHLAKQLTDALLLTPVETNLLRYLLQACDWRTGSRVSPEIVLQRLLNRIRRAAFRIGSSGLEVAFPDAGPEFSRAVATSTLIRALGIPRSTLSNALADLVTRFQQSLLVAGPLPPPLETGFQPLFDGRPATMKDWAFAGPGEFALVDGTMEARPGDDFGILYYTARRVGNFTLRLEFRLQGPEDNSGVFVRFRDPRLPVPDRANPTISYPYEKAQWVPVHTGFQIKIDEVGRGMSPGQDEHRSGALYGIPATEQHYQPPPPLEPGAWYGCEITANGQEYSVSVAGVKTASYWNGDSFRGKSPDEDSYSGHIGVQSFLGSMAFRNIRVQLHPGPNLR